MSGERRERGERKRGEIRQIERRGIERREIEQEGLDTFLCINQAQGLRAFTPLFFLLVQYQENRMYMYVNMSGATRGIVVKKVEQGEIEL